MGDLNVIIKINGDDSNPGRTIDITPRRFGSPPNSYANINIRAGSSNAGINLGQKELNQLLEAIHLALIAMRESKGDTSS